MPRSADAVIGEQDDRTTLRFERVLRHPPERVWRALTEQDELQAWHPTPFALQPQPGGSVTYAQSERGQAMPTGEVVEHEPHHRLSYTWGEDLLRFELHPHEDGCLLVLTHVFDDRMKAARDAAGWHLCLQTLASALDDDAAADSSTSEHRLPHGWNELNDEYQQRFGIAPEQATPPPPRY